MRFAAPEWLWLLSLVPLLALASWWTYARRRKALQRFAGGQLHADRFTGGVSRHRRAIKMILLYLVICALPLSLARPQWGTRLEPITRRGADVVIVLDTSLSMSAEDLAPSRLEQAKHAIGSLLDLLVGDRVALVTFAGRAHLSCPLTVDHGAVRLFLDAIQVDEVPVPGTAVAEALQAGLEALRIDEPELDDRGRALVLLTDGEDHAGEIESVLDAFAGSGVAVHTVGCGTDRGAPIPIRDAAGMITGYKKDGEGKVVTTRLSEDVLERIALETGGRYYRATTSEIEVEEIGQSLASLSQGELGSELRTRYEERFQIPLLVGWLALVAETMLGDRRRARRTVARDPRGAAG
jgi:Ca-activated chloride channel family protein